MTTDPARAALLMDLAERCEKAKADEQKAALEDVLQALHLYSTVFRLLDNHAYLDAAMSLVPEGWAWAVYGGAREEIVATAYCVPNGGRLPWPDWVTDICAATPALALCAAALRALASGAPR